MDNIKRNCTITIIFKTQRTDLLYIVIKVQKIEKWPWHVLDNKQSSVIMPPVYEVYGGYIAFVFSVTMFVDVCGCKLYFLSKISQELPLFIHFSFSPIKISVTYFSASMRAKVFKF